VVWAGAQPRDENALDPAFLERLHALLNLTDRTGLHVILDNHGDMVGGAGCGNGVPMWVSQKAAPELIGKPLTSAFPFELFDETNVKRAKGYSHCGTAHPPARLPSDSHATVAHRQPQRGLTQQWMTQGPTARSGPRTPATPTTTCSASAAWLSTHTATRPR
jgi:hypothetical protein